MLFEQRGYFRRATGVTFFLRGGAFRAEGVLPTCNVVFFERGCFSSRGGTSDVQHGLFLRGGAFPAEGVLLMCNVVFFERGCFSSRGGTSDMQRGLF